MSSHGLVVMHSCDTPACIEPKHLKLGTVADNNRDMAQKGRCRNQHTDKAECYLGHSLLNPYNVRVEGTRRRCRACGRLRTARYRVRKEGQHGR